MSSREKELAEKIAAMPHALQDKFLDQARGAELALDILAKEKGGEPDAEGTPAVQGLDGEAE